jgi:hypothetical protein
MHAHMSDLNRGDARGGLEPRCALAGSRLSSFRLRKLIKAVTVSQPRGTGTLHRMESVFQDYQSNRLANSPSASSGRLVLRVLSETLRMPTSVCFASKVWLVFENPARRTVTALIREI